MSENAALHDLLAEFAHPARDSDVVLHIYDIGRDGEGSDVVVTVNFRRYDWYVSLERRPSGGDWCAVFEPSFSESIFDQPALSRLVTDIGMIDALCLHLAAWEPSE